jgi:uncharacterized protein (DUF362 family)
VNSRVALAREVDRRRTVARALALVADEVRLAGCRQVLVKPNLVSTTRQLASTHPDGLDAVLAFVRARHDGPLVVADGSALAPTTDAFDRFGFRAVVERYGAELVDLNADEPVAVEIVDRRGRPQTLRLARTVVDSDYRIALGPPKTHDTVIVTLSIKNMIMGSLLNRTLVTGGTPAGHASQWPPGHLGRLDRLRMRLGLGVASDKLAMHQGYPTIHRNLAALAPWVWPHLAVIDGWLAMEGAGPIDGDEVAWHLALAGTDALAVDAFTAGLMGFDPASVGYLEYCRRLGLGVGDFDAIRSIGDVAPAAVRRQFRPHPSYQHQLAWQLPAGSPAPRRAPAVPAGAVRG